MRTTPIDIQGVIFDLDGTLIDSIGLYFQILRSAFNTLGIPPVSDSIVAEAVKEGSVDWDILLPRFSKERKERTLKEISNLIKKSYDQVFNKDIRLIPGVADIVNKIADAGFKTAIVTSTPKAYLENKIYALKRSNLMHRFEVIITTDDSPRKKPSKDPLVLCAARLGIEAHRCVYVGDMRVDIRAGKAAGMFTAGVLTGFDDYSQLKSEKPDMIIDSVAQLFQVIRKAGT